VSPLGERQELVVPTAKKQLAEEQDKGRRVKNKGYSTSFGESYDLGF
jgi:hypothetical protein